MDLYTQDIVAELHIIYADVLHNAGKMQVVVKLLNQEKISENRAQIIEILPDLVADEFKSKAPIAHLVCSAWLEKPDGVSKV